MFEALLLCALLFICRKLKDSGVPKLATNIFIALFVLWLLLGFATGYDFSHAEYDIFPLHFTEMIRAINITLVIIVLYAFMSFFAIDLITGFSVFTKRKAICALLLTIAITLYSMAEAYCVRRKDITITTNKLPEGTDRIRIAFLVDVHLGGLYTVSHFERAMKIVDEASPDIIMLGGDIIDGDLSHMKTELAKIGAELRVLNENEVLLKPVTTLPFFELSHPLRFASHNDHRIVMALAPLALKVGSVAFDHPEVVRKSYPTFWSDTRFLLI